MLEREKKFKLKYLPNGLTRHEIWQGYLMFDGKKHLRVRITDGIKAELGYKTIQTSEDRDEYEYEIPMSDAVEMLKSTEIKLEKARYRTFHDGNSVDIDIVLEGGVEHQGKGWVEIEFKDSIESLPDYCGEEVTEQKEYSNIYIAQEIAKRNKK